MAILCTLINGSVCVCTRPRVCVGLRYGDWSNWRISIYANVIMTCGWLTCCAKQLLRMSLYIQTQTQTQTQTHRNCPSQFSRKYIFLLLSWRFIHVEDIRKDMNLMLSLGIPVVFHIMCWCVNINQENRQLSVSLRSQRDCRRSKIRYYRNQIDKHTHTHRPYNHNLLEACNHNDCRCL